MLHPAAAQITTPGSSDWIVTIERKDGGIVSRRISPGSMDEPAAIRIALTAGGMSGLEVDRWSIRRAGEAVVSVDAVDDFLEALRRRR